MNLIFYCTKCGGYLESPKFKKSDNNVIELSINPCQKCLKNEYTQGEKAAAIKIELDKKLKEATNLDLMDLAKTTKYNNLEIIT